MRAAVGLALAVAAGCGQVVFVDPDADAKAALRLVEAEHLVIADDPRTYLHVRFRTVTATRGLELVAKTPEGAAQLPWSAAHRSRCDPQQTCLAFTLGPGLAAPSRVELLAPDLAHAHEIPVIRRDLEGYALFAEARSANTEIRVDLLDPIRRHFSGVATATTGPAFERRFEAHVAPGPCGAPPAPTAAGWAGMEGPPATLPARFSEGPDPVACVFVRPEHPALGPPVGARTVGARAEVTRFRQVYTPPQERAPIVFLPLFDLEIPNPARCEEAEGLVLSAVLDAAVRIAEATGVEVLPLAPVEIAEIDGVACRQDNRRGFDADAVVQRANEAIAAAFGPDRRVRILWLYAQNLDFPLPSTLDQSFVRLRSLIRSDTVHLDYLFTLAPNRVQDQLQPDRHLAWLATEEPQFRTAIRGMLSALWPFTSLNQGPNTLVPLVRVEDRDRFEAFRICEASAFLSPVGTPAAPDGALFPGPMGPAFTISLPEQRLLPASEIRAPSVAVDWEGCTGRCDRPAPGADPRVPWLEASGC